MGGWVGGWSGAKRGGGGALGIPSGPVGVHVAEDRLLIERKYTACCAAVA